MTAETLKSFISSPGSTTFRTTSSSTTKSSYKNNIYVIWLWICLIFIVIITFSCLIGFTIWNTNRISKLEKNFTNIYERLGLYYLDELEKDDFYSKNILDDTDDSDEGILLDSYEDEHGIDNDNDDTNTSNNLNNNDAHNGEGSGEYDNDDAEDNVYDDNFYDDFGKFKKTKEIKDINLENKKRKIRSLIDTKSNLETSINDKYINTDINDNNNNNNDDEIEILQSKINIRRSLSLSSLSSVAALNYDNLNLNDRLNRRKRGENYATYRNQPVSESINQPQLITSQNVYRQQIENRNDLRHMTTEPQKYHSGLYQNIHHQGSNNNNNDILSGSQRHQNNNSRSRIIAIHFTLNGSNPYSYIDDKHYYNHHSKDITKSSFYDGDLYTVKVQQQLLSSSIQHKLFLNKLFKYENGIIRIKLNGIYLIYGQVYYHNNINTNGFNIFHNDEPILQCAITIPTSTITSTPYYDVNHKSNTCYTSGITYLKSDDIIYIRDLHKNRAVSLKDSKSFIGLIRLG